ncbi:hypothetical protein [Nocardioides sp. GY 10113]|nr:hypothetical protein [Nocardioides sp. GY 10113]
MEGNANDQRSRQQLAERMARATQRRIDARTRAAQRRRQQAAGLL